MDVNSVITQITQLVNRSCEHVQENHSLNTRHQERGLCSIQLNKNSAGKKATIATAFNTEEQYKNRTFFSLII